MEQRKADLIPTAATDLVESMNKEINHIFTPRYTEFSDGRRVQNNPFSDMDEASKTEVTVEALTILLAQFGALILAESDNLDPNVVYTNFDKRIRNRGESYRQILLKMKEAHNDTKTESKGTQGRNESSEPVVPSI